jgi:flagellar protein FlaI
MADSSELPQSRLSTPDGITDAEFFGEDDGTETLTSRADLEAAVPNDKKDQLVELERYWVNKPYAFAIIFRDTARQELRYYLVEPDTSETEDTLIEFFANKLRHTIEYESVATELTQPARAEIVRNSLLELLTRYDLIPTGNSPGSGMFATAKQWTVGALDKWLHSGTNGSQSPLSATSFDGDAPTTLTPDQIEIVTYYLIRNFVRYDKIDGLKHDPQIEEVSCDGYQTPIWVYHTNYEHIMTNVSFAPDSLDKFVISAAQAAGKGISKRQPQVDAALRDGSRAQLTLGTEVSDKGTNFTIREFMDIPHTPVDLINWRTFSLPEMVLLWLATENGLSTVVSGGTASGKTTTLNALSLFIPATKKIVSIEDTREIQIPQQNWIASTTRRSFHKGDGNAINEMELVETALRQRPDYLLMGEVRGEEAQALFQAMNTGHTVFTTFHANDKNETLRRFTGDPLNVSPPLIEAVDLIISQIQTKTGGNKVRRAQSIASVGGSTNNSLKTTTLYSWDPPTDAHEQLVGSFADTEIPDTAVLNKVAELNGWTQTELRREWNNRMAVLLSLVTNNITAYADVAAVIQAFTQSPESILQLIAESRLAEQVDALRDMETIDVDVDPTAEDSVLRPDAHPQLQEQASSFLPDMRRSLTDGQSPDAVTQQSQANGSQSSPQSQSQTQSEHGNSTESRQTAVAADSDPSTEEHTDPDKLDITQSEFQDALAELEDPDGDDLSGFSQSRPVNSAQTQTQPQGENSTQTRSDGEPDPDPDSSSEHTHTPRSDTDNLSLPSTHPQNQSEDTDTQHTLPQREEEEEEDTHQDTQTDANTGPSDQPPSHDQDNSSQGSDSATDMSSQLDFDLGVDTDLTSTDNSGELPSSDTAHSPDSDNSSPIDEHVSSRGPVTDPDSETHADTTTQSTGGEPGTESGEGETDGQTDNTKEGPPSKEFRWTDTTTSGTDGDTETDSASEDTN